MYRREFLKMCGLTGLATGIGTHQLSFANARTLAGKSGITPRGSAENLILVFLRGAPSHMDTFDLKLGSWTPDNFAPVTKGDLVLPSGIFPNLVQQTDKFSVLRAISGTEAVHQRASYIFETAHTYNPVFAREQPHIGSLAAFELAATRKTEDIFPAFLAMNGSVQGPGMLSSSHAAFSFSSADGIAGLTHADGEEMFAKRYASLLKTDADNRFKQSGQGAILSDYHNFFELAEKLMYESDTNEVFFPTENDLARYGENETGAACATAVKALAANRGTRIVQITQDGWDMHYDIYDEAVGGNIYQLATVLDQALATMLQDLANQPGIRGGTLLDETMVVVTGEFGRTPGQLTGNLGRDHYPYAWSALVAGGGIIPGQAFGATDDEGWTIIDPFWGQPRYISIQDLVATMYSSLGIDWTKEIQDTPSGRVYEYTPKVDGQQGFYTDIPEMFG